MLSWVIVLLAAGTMLALALLAGYALGWANKTFRIEVDPRIEEIVKALPGANCGGCGFVGCADYAAGVVEGQATVDKCTVGGAACAQALAKIMGVELKEAFPYRPAVHCGARLADRLKRNDYQGEATCGAANIISGVQGCVYGCLGLGDCTRACKYDAVHDVDGLAVVDYDKCVGCGACARACPRNIISMVPFKAERMLIVACSNKDFGKAVKEVCRVGCLGCRACTRISDLFSVVDNLSRIDYDKYDPAAPAKFMDAVKKCPMKRLVFIGKPSEQDLAAVADKEVPAEVKPDFKTTVDRTEWRG